MTGALGSGATLGLLGLYAAFGALRQPVWDAEAPRWMAQRSSSGAVGGISSVWTASSHAADSPAVAFPVHTKIVCRPIPALSARARPGRTVEPPSEPGRRTPVMRWPVDLRARGEHHADAVPWRICGAEGGTGPGI